MNNSGHIADILKKLQKYKRKYYLNKLFKGVLISLAYLLMAFIGVSFLEYQLHLNSSFRSLIAILFSASGLYFLIRYIAIPSFYLLGNGKHLSNKEAAIQIGKYFPEINDKLLNFIQLNDLTSRENSLVQASIEQKSQGLSPFNFSESIKIQKSNKKYFPYVIVPVILLAIILMFAPYMVTEGSYRIIKFNEEFIPKAPFMFHVETETLKAYKGEPFQIHLKLSGTELPAEVFINKDGIKQKLQKQDHKTFEYIINSPQEDINFHFEGAGFSSKNYILKVYERPAVQNMAIELVYPAYTGTRRERIENSGNLIVPEGTMAEWWLQSKATDEVVFSSKSDSSETLFEKTGDKTFHLEKTLLNSQSYQLELFNQNAVGENKASYSIEVIKDKSPEITLESVNDSSLFSQVALAGEISDDYGFTKFHLVYSITNNGSQKKKGTKPLPFKKDILNQKYFQLWSIDSLVQEEGDIVQYYLEIYDNDAINGAKSTRSTVHTFKRPDKEEIEKSIKNSAQVSENQLDKNIQKSRKLNQNLEDLEKILKTKRNLNWEDKKLLEEIVEEKELLEKELEKIKQEMEQNREKREKYEQQNPDLKEKSEQLESLMEEMLKDKNDELLEKIKELLEKENQSDEFRESVQELKKKESNKLKEMERLMELFKRLEIQYDMNKVGEDLEKIAEEQKELGEKTEQADESNKEKALEQQEKLNEEFEEIKESLEDIKERNQSLKQPSPIDDTKEHENQIDQSQQESSEQLEQNNQKGASKSQKKAAEEMKKMAKMMAQMQSSMEMEALQENIDDLRDIVDNLLKLSFRQEALMKDFRDVNASDPRFITLSEKQLNMKEDAIIVEDSLNALAERVFQLKTFITKEMSTMNTSMQSSLDALKERDKNKAVGEQQFAMTSMNNLALMLDDVLQQMQMQMQASMGMDSKPQQGNQQQPGISEMQKALNQETKELSEGQKSGRELSEKLGELAAEQARLRKMLKEMQEQSNDKDGKEGGGGLGETIEEMEKIEEEIVNKRINNQLIERQEKIVTRLLEAEKAKQEQEEDDERKGETATDYEKERLPNAFEEYLKQKEKEIELLQSVSPSFTPYYRNEINKYYKRLKSTENKSL
ncbi:hypothetical protein JKA74_19035 [Marivirga sp. S37H4]|uniref:ATPase n=1 Tax=Marivirga aurantiaca TaxID=2802615 RepID=A0A935CC18_9BACT|nr:DUF4175 family protein [Marivirga aurantiaca]MBK6267147.1 hypothetical protein [Marivirga aurantiaca]